MVVRKSQLPPSLARPESGEFRALLSGWRGRGFLQASLEARGFFIPVRYQKIVSELCPESDSEGLDKYWDEMARELILSGGRANSWFRQVPDGAYRSPYLDDLARGQLLGWHLPLHPCARAFHEKIMADREIYPKIVRNLGREKHRDIGNIGVSPYRWAGSEDDVYSILEQMFKDKGFSKKKEEFIRETDIGLSFCADITSGSLGCAVSIPLTFSVFMSKCPDQIFRFGPENIVPGYEFYYGFNNVEAGLLGFRAYVEFVDLLSLSFDEPSPV